MGNWKRAIAIDFDGTLCENNYPDIGEPNWNVIYQAIQEQKHGAGLILWTCREGKLLYDAMEACFDWGIQFDAINESLPEWKEHFGTAPRKVGADEYWDDKAVPVKDGSLDIKNNEKLTIEELKEMAGLPVWCSDSECWTLVECEKKGPWKDVPFVSFRKNGSSFTWNVVNRELSCYRGKV